MAAPQHEDAGSPSSTASGTRHHYRTVATPGASTRCTTSPTASPTPWKGITHSLCTLEFENNREIYDWILDNVTIDVRPAAAPSRPSSPGSICQLHGALSKRKLLELVRRTDTWTAGTTPGCPASEGHAPRGATPLEAILGSFCDRHGRGQGQQHRRRRPLLEHSHARRPQPPARPGFSGSAAILCGWSSTNYAEGARRRGWRLPYWPARRRRGRAPAA